MRTLHFGLRVSDIDQSRAFYEAVGYEVVGVVPDTPFGSLTMIKLPDDPFVAIELVHDPARPAAPSNRLNHFVIHVETMRDAIASLAQRGVVAEEPTSPDGSADFLTSWIEDPDGNRIELVQWAAGHAEGITAADMSG